MGKTCPPTLIHPPTPYTQGSVLLGCIAQGPFPRWISLRREPRGNCTSELVTFCGAWFACFLLGAQCRLLFSPCKLTNGHSAIFKARCTGLACLPLTRFALKDLDPRPVLQTRAGPVPPSWHLFVEPWLSFSTLPHPAYPAWLVAPGEKPIVSSPAPGLCKCYQKLRLRSGRGGPGLCRDERKLVALKTQGLISLLSLGLL